MHLHNEKYAVLTSVEEQPFLDQYDIVHNTEKIDTNGYFMTRTFRITRLDGHSLKIALLDLICSNYEPYAALEGNILTTILFDSIVRIDMDTGLIIQYEKCDNIGGLFEIHPIDGGYLIWGEGEIFRYDSHLKQIWSFSGRDILVSLHSKQHFWIDDNQIHCRDFLGWHYILDLDGNLIADFREFGDSETL
ncbi:hypothetical protein [Pseudoflavonifractor sp. HCP28S3_F10]|uniref:hypothetical protein n=1 Tax=Pseudoflavonifractor sp. HCP28S3_F10 TaxID=3438947 RepID=UPI003F8A4707